MQSFILFFFPFGGWVRFALILGFILLCSRRGGWDGGRPTGVVYCTSHAGPALPFAGCSCRCGPGRTGAWTLGLWSAGEGHAWPSPPPPLTIYCPGRLNLTASGRHEIFIGYVLVKLHKLFTVVAFPVDGTVEDLHFSREPRNATPRHATPRPQCIQCCSADTQPTHRLLSVRPSARPTS